MPTTILIRGVYEIATGERMLNPTLVAGDATILIPGGTRVATTNAPAIAEPGFSEITITLTDAEYVEGAIIRLADQRGVPVWQWSGTVEVLAAQTVDLDLVAISNQIASDIEEQQNNWDAASATLKVVLDTGCDSLPGVEALAEFLAAATISGTLNVEQRSPDYIRKIRGDDHTALRAVMFDFESVKATIDGQATFTIRDCFTDEIAGQFTTNVFQNVSAGNWAAVFELETFLECAEPGEYKFDCELEITDSDKTTIALGILDLVEDQTRPG